jgi:amino acid permease
MKKSTAVYIIALVAVVMLVYYYLETGGILNIIPQQAENALIFVPIAVIVLVAAVLLVPFFFAMKGPFEERKDTILSKVKER